MSDADCSRILQATGLARGPAEQACRGSSRHTWLTVTVANSAATDLGALCDVADAGGTPTWTRARLADPTATGLATGIGIPAHASRSITWQVDESPATSYSVRCRVNHAQNAP